MSGQRIGRLTVQDRAGVDADGRVTWRCKCDCGRTKSIRGKHLRRGVIKSCGCIARERAATMCLTQNGLMVANRAEYSTWRSMLARCEKHAGYAGRGIKVCDRWRQSFADFLADMGPRPSGLTIERVNNDGNYEPGNCRWATRHEQMRNTRSNRYIEIGGRRMIITDWASEFGVPIALVYERIGRGWSDERAVSQPPRHITRTPAYERTRPRKAA